MNRPDRVFRFLLFLSVSMFKIILLLSSAFFFAELAVSLSDDRSPTRIHALIADLGDDVFVVRERAETQLLRIGIDAFAELKQATKSDDVEIATRARRILSQFEQIYRGKENESVRDMVDLYTQEPNVAQKTQYLWILADPMEYPNGEALRTLCRIARFDTEYTLRAEAVKCLIASPPIAPTKRKDWFKTLRIVFADQSDDELLQLVGDYATLYGNLEVLREDAEKKAETQEKETGVLVEYPVPFTVSKELQTAVRSLTDRLAAFQTKPENSDVQPGHRFDILLFHALAELQDASGLVAERDRTLEAALAVRTEKMRSENPLFLIDPLDESSFSEHFHAAVLLERRCRFLWAERHLRLVFAEAPVTMKIRAGETLWFVMQMLDRFRESIELHDSCLELVKSGEYKLNDSDTKVKHFVAAKNFCLAKLAAADEDWQKVRESIDLSLKNDPTDCDAVILRYEASKHLNNLDEQYKAETKRLIGDILNRTEQIFLQRSNNMGVAVLCNQAAWLLANTDGDFQTALTLIQITTKSEPESPMYLDTMAHVYALGKDYKKAGEVQKEAVRLAPEATTLRLSLERFRKLVTSDHRR